MATYKNGQIPRTLLVHMGGEHWTTVGTKAKIEALIADIWENEGVRVWVTSGPNIYRDLQNQKDTKRHFINIGKGWMAAYPGSSSHGGEYKGRDCLAVDFSGYGPLGITKWYAYLRKHGFEAGYFNGQNGRPYEPWHAIDWVPYRKVAAPAGDMTPIPAVPEEEDEPMTGRFTYKRSDGKTVRVVHGEGYFEEHTDAKIKNADINLSLNLPEDAPWPAMPESYRDNVYNATLAVRTGAQGTHRAP